MTISNQDARTGPYSGNGATTSFAYDFKVIDEDHLVVTLKNSSDVETVQTITTHYTVTGVGNDGGGTVEMVTAPASGETLTISRAIPLTQDVDLANRGGVQPEVLETAYDKLTQAVQDQAELFARSPRFPVSSSLTNVELPLTLTANAALTINATGTAFTNGPTTTEISNAQTYATNAANSATAAATSAATAATYAGTQSVDRFSGTGSQTDFTLSQPPATENNTMVYVSGVYQQKDTYSVSGTTLSFSSAPPSGTDNIEVVHMSTTPTGVDPIIGTVTTGAAGSNASVTATGATLDFTIPRGDTGATGPQGIQGETGPAGSLSGAADGSAAAPSISFNADTNTGLFRPGADQIGFTTGGTSAMTIDASQNVAIGADLAVSDEMGYTVTTANLPASRSSLNLNFANAGVLDSRVTFTRTSTGTYVDSAGIIQTATNDVARLNHDSNGAPKGLLLEGARTNYFTYSAEFDNAAWTFKTRCSVSANAVTAPDGTLTADKLVEDATASDTHYLNANNHQQTAQAWCQSIYAKAAERDIIYLGTNASTLADAVFFNLSTGAASNAGANIADYGIEDAGGGWYRCWISIASGTSGNYDAIGLATTAGNNSYSGDGTSGVHIWGAQGEVGLFPSSYIPTSGAATTRAADLFSLALSDVPVYNEASGTLLAECSVDHLSGQDRSVAFIQTGAAASYAEAVGVFFDPTQMDLWMSTASVATYRWNAGPTVSDGQTVKVALAYEVNNTVGAVNGTLDTVDTSCALPVSPTTLYLGQGAGGQPLYGHITRFSYYPTRLTDAQLVALTEA